MRRFNLVMLRILIVAFLMVTGCHRSGREFTMALLREELRGLEQRTTVEFLADLYPGYEEWLILPGIPAPASWADSLGIWLESYRIVSPDSLDSSDWTRFLRQSNRAEFLSVLGYIEKPRVVSPRGFRGFLIRFRVMGVESSALLVDRTAMRWLTWLERTAVLHADSGYTHEVDSLAARISEHLVSWHGDVHSVPEIPDVSVMHSLYEQPSTVVLEPVELFEIARDHAQPSIEGVNGGVARVPTPGLIDRIRNQPVLPELSLLEPELLQRRLLAMQRAEWPCFYLSYSAMRNLGPGTYLWAEGPYEQLWAAPVEMHSMPGDDVISPGPSVLFFGRDVAGAGMVIAGGNESDSRIVEINTYPFEYGLSPYSPVSLRIAERSGDLLFSRMRRIISRITDAANGLRIPVLRTLPEYRPVPGAWRQRARPEK